MNRKVLTVITLSCCIFSSGVAHAQTPEQCLEIVTIESSILSGTLPGAKAYIHSTIPDPAAYLNSLPTREKVIASKDKINFKNYGGLAEAYIFNGDQKNGEQLYDWFAANAKAVLGDADTFPALVSGDIALSYYDQGDYIHAEPLFRKAIDGLEKHSSAAEANNLLCNYFALVMICKKQGKMEEATQLAKKAIELRAREQKAGSPN